MGSKAKRASHKESDVHHQSKRSKTGLEHDKSDLKGLEEANSCLHLPGPNFKEKLRVEDSKPHVPSVTELEELDHTIVNIAYQIEQLLVKFQYLRSIDLDSAASETKDKLARSFMKRHRVRLAALLVKQYWNQGIPILDDIVFLRHSSNISVLPQKLGSGSLDIKYLDELQALLIHSAVDSIKTLAQRANGNELFLEQTDKTIKELQNIELNESKSHVTDSFSNENDSHDTKKSWPPSLPEINDESLLQQVFTHRSAVSDASLVNTTNILNTHNERLEFKGDSVLDFIVCQMLFDAFPNDTEGSLSIKKAALVCNDTLFDFSVIYKLYSKLKISSDLHNKVYESPTSNVPDAFHKNKAVADVFEAYIGGLALDRGLIVVQNWLVDLYAPMIQEMQQGSTVDEVDKNAKNELYRKVGSAIHPITYITVKDSPPFEVKCLIAGEEVSRGVDRSVKLAGLRAAKAALNQPKLIEKFAAIRREVPKTAPSTKK